MVISTVFVGEWSMFQRAGVNNYQLSIRSLPTFWQHAIYVCNTHCMGHRVWHFKAILGYALSWIRKHNQRNRMVVPLEVPKWNKEQLRSPVGSDTVKQSLQVYQVTDGSVLCRFWVKKTTLRVPRALVFRTHFDDYTRKTTVLLAAQMTKVRKKLDRQHLREECSDHTKHDHANHIKRMSLYHAHYDP